MFIAMILEWHTSMVESAALLHDASKCFLEVDPRFPSELCFARVVSYRTLCKLRLIRGTCPARSRFPPRSAAFARSAPPARTRTVPSGR